MTQKQLPSLADMLKATPYVAYTYSYPHKTAYRRFPEPLPLADLWANEQRDVLSLYMHVPFCEMRCGFCNLFTTVNPTQSLETSYLETLYREAQRTREALGEFRMASFAIGGGTPTYLSLEELDRLFGMAKKLFGIEPGTIPISVEASPMTAELEKLQLLRAHGVERLSIGVQSFLEAETKAAGRPQKTSTVEQALETIRRVDFSTHEPEELYLYPLYVRPLTGLGRRASAQKSEHDVRLACYRAGRELLLARGYTQISMRMFRATRVHEQTGPVYCAQEDGMVGLGCGARSYTSACQYASEYAVSARGVRTILQEYIAQPAEAFIYARYGFFLDEEEQRRRSVITALFDTGGIDPAFYRRRFDSEILADFPAFQELLERELIASRDGRFVLTEAGLERSDVIGPWLYSQQVQALMEGYQLQ